MKKISFLYILIIISLSSTAQTKRTLLYNGSSATKFDLVFMGDGFTSSQQTEFNNKVDQYFKAAFTHENGALDDVMSELQDAFNVYRVNMNSATSGVSQRACSKPDGTACGKTPATRNTAFNFRYSGCWDCCWMSKSSNTDSRINNALAAVGLSGADYIVMILNESGFGGCSYGRVLSVTKTTSNRVIVHELGHSVGGLADEYDRSGCFSGSNPSRRNADKNKNNSKWNKFARGTITTGNPQEYNVSQTGHFEGAVYKDECIYRPTSNSTMRGNTNLFNPPSYDEFWKRNKPRSSYNFNRVITGNFGGSNHNDVLLHYGRYIAAYQVGIPDGFTGSGATMRVKSSYLTTKKVKGPGGTWYFSNNDKIQSGDFSGDGKDDLIVFRPNGKYSMLGLLKSVNNGFECTKIYYYNLPGWAMRSGDRYYIADFNGDGKKDIYVFNATNWSMGYVGMLRSTGSALAYVKRYDKYLPGNYITNSDELYIADINGDNKEEFILFKRNTQTTRVYRSNSNSLTKTSEYFQSLPGWSSKSNDKYFIADFNGDNKDDLFVFNGNQWSTQYLLMLRSDGSNLIYRKRYDDRIPNWNMSNNDKFYPADINGDGKEELYVFNTKDWSTEWVGTLISSGTGIEAITKQSNWIGSWNLGANDKIIIDDRSSGRDNVFVHNKDWFGYLWSGSPGLFMNSIYKDYIHAFKHHDNGWY